MNVLNKQFLVRTLFAGVVGVCFAVPMAMAWNNTNNNVVLYFNGYPQPNTEVGFDNFPKDIQKFCSLYTCIPTTQFNVVNPVTNNKIGYVNVWAANYITEYSPSLCFTEIIQYNLSVKDNYGKVKQGRVYTLGNNAGTCGAYTNPLLVKPVGEGSDVVVVGGGGGNGALPPDSDGISHGIVGATGDFSYLKGGSYIDRVFVEFNAANVINYYDGLYFTLQAPGNR